MGVLMGESFGVLVADIVVGGLWCREACKNSGAREEEFKLVVVKEEASGEDEPGVQLSGSICHAYAPEMNITCDAVAFGQATRGRVQWAPTLICSLTTMTYDDSYSSLSGSVLVDDDSTARGLCVSLVIVSEYMIRRSTIDIVFDELKFVRIPLCYPSTDSQTSRILIHGACVAKRTIATL